MADVFISHLEWTGAAKGPTRDPATFSRDLDVSMGATTLPISSAPGYRGDPSRADPRRAFRRVAERVSRADVSIPRGEEPDPCDRLHRRC